MLNHKKQMAVDWRIFVLMIMGVIFIAIYSSLAFSLPRGWTSQPKLILNSPDETSNLFFSRQFAQQSSLQFKDEANEIAENLITPRSMRVINGLTVPASFLGLPLIYGTIAKITGNSFIPFLTPIIGIIGLIFFYLWLKVIFDKNTAFISALFAFILPPFWYYSTKSLMPNIAFVSFFIMALYFFVKIIKKSKSGYTAQRLLASGLGGFFLALSLMIRTSEIVWIGPLFLILTIIYFKEINFKFLILSLIVFLITFSPIFYFNQQIYDRPLSLGYALEIDLQDKNLIEQGLTIGGKLFLPFGFHPRLALKNLYNYTFKIFPFWSILISSGILIFTISSLVRGKKTLLLYLAIFIVNTAYLTIYYGSWPFHDHPDPNLVTIGTSYIRYWLPIYLFALPFLGGAITRLFKKIRTALPVTVILLFILSAISSYRLVMLDQEEGIYQVKKNLVNYQDINAAVIKQTESNSIIIADTMDKVFFPLRRVIFRLNVPKDYETIRELVEADYPVYYFYFTRGEMELAKFNQKYYEPHGLIIEKSILDFKKQSLYPVKLMRRQVLSTFGGSIN